MITVDGKVLSIREAYATCKGVLHCRGKLTKNFERTDFNNEYGEDGPAYFVQRLLYNAHSPGTVAQAEDGREVSLTKF